MKSINRKSVFVFLLSIAMILSISACGGTDSSGSDDGAGATEAPASTEAPTDATEAPAEATEAPAGDVVAAFNFNNKGDKEICEMYLSPTAQDNWGTDQLKGQTITAGGTFTLTNIPAGDYDVKAVFCGGAGEEVLPNITISN